MTGAELEADTKSKKVFQFLRPEDGTWDPSKSFSGDYYFVTTASFTGNSRLWKLHFNDVANPEKGGTLEVLINGGAATPGPAANRRARCPRIRPTPQRFWSICRPRPPLWSERAPGRRSPST
jgi:hypothetical protein